MANIIIQDISVSYGAKKILQNFSLTVADGECCAILGPSACGKTTLARAICGFNKLEHGDIYIGDHLVSSKAGNICLAPEKRHIGVVFQDYAVWPHMSVFENIYYPLKKRRIEKGLAMRKVQSVLEQVQMWEYRERLPSQLSGGQQQRVAIARALVVSGEVMILDEPITNLDANLREEMRFEIKDLQKRTGITVLYITQDQSDALAIADRIVVMDQGGRIRQIGTPETIYKEPADSFVYSFLGLSNFLPVYLEGNHAYLNQDGDGYGGKTRIQYEIPQDMRHKQKIIMASRPMDVELNQAGTLAGRVKNITFLGNIYEYRIVFGDAELRVQQGAHEALTAGLFSPGDRCGIHFTNPRFYDQLQDG